MYVVHVGVDHMISNDSAAGVAGICCCALCIVHTIEFIGASLSEPHTNRYYEKNAIVMYVCMYVCDHDTSSTCFARMRYIYPSPFPLETPRAVSK